MPGVKLALVRLIDIDEPDLPVRQTFDQEELRELAESIGAVGMIEPVVLERRGSRYVVAAGHRRIIAAGLARLEAVPALVAAEGDLDIEAVKCHENACREAVNPAEQAMYYARLLEARCGDDVDQLCHLVKQRREFVEQRLLLLKGDEYVFDAVRRRELSLAVARELNRIKDTGYRRMYLDAVIKGGASAALVRQWRCEQERIAALTPESQAAATPASGADAVTASTPAPMECWFCGRSHDAYNLRLKWVHPHCQDAVDGVLGRAAP